MEIYPLAPQHAATAARLHIAGQPGTFLTSLGADVLTVLYQALPQSPVGFGFAALPQDNANAAPLGFVSATTSIGTLLVEMGTRRILHFVPPLLKRFAQQPTLALRSVQTVLYPFLTKSEPASHDTPSHDTASHNSASHNNSSAELLSIMVEPQQRSRGIGGLLMEALLVECAERQISTLDVTVDAANEGAQRFYHRHGFAHHHDFQLYGRAMSSLQLKVESGIQTP